MRPSFTFVITFLLGICSQSSIAVTIHENYQKVEALLRIGPEPERQIWMTERGHTLLLPGDDPDDIQGIVVFFQRGKIVADTTAPGPGSFDAEALARSVAVLHVSTGNPLDFFFDDTTMVWAADYIQALLDTHELHDVPVYFAGLSLGGTRALKFAQFLNEHHGEFWLHAAAVAVVDSPLDMTRFWRAEKRAAELNFNAIAADEGRWVTYLLSENLGGSPEESPDAYRNYSVYTYGAPDGGRAALLQTIPVRAYHEPDVDWWIENRRKDYYEMNSIDLAALITELKLQGNDRAELVTTCNAREEYESGGSPHTWSFVDNADLVDWFLRVSHRQ